MKKVNTAFARNSNPRRPFSDRSRGFTLIELMMAMVVFLIIAGTAFSVFNQHINSITTQENLSGVNLALRNATAQLQMDVSAGGQNLLAGAPSAPDFSAGVIINNSVPGKAAACTPNASYGYPVPSACFDSITIFGPQKTGCAATTTGYPPVLLLASDHGATQSAASSPFYGTDPTNSANNAADAACYKSGDELLVIETGEGGGTLQCGGGASDQWPYCMTAVTLTSAASTSGSDIQLAIDTASSSGQASGCPGAACSDPQGILTNPGGTPNYTYALASSFSPSATSYIVDIGQSTSVVTYQVQLNPSNAADPQLVRCDVNGCAVLADQIIGFKVGAALSSNEANGQPDIANYYYDSSQYCTEALINGVSVDCDTAPTNNAPYDYTLVRAVRVSLVARTAPRTDITFNKFSNGFDGGPYLIQQASTVVDLRGVSIGEFQN
jgi:prepilin-type N-terminal cleavage/methylation domain-containing protein